MSWTRRAAFFLCSSLAWASDDVAVTSILEPFDVDGFKVHLTAPSRADSYPVVVFMSGFTGAVPVNMYSDLLVRVVKKGYIVAAIDHTLGYPDYVELSKHYNTVINWALNGGLQTLIGKGNMTAKADVARLVALGQSSGNHVIAGALAQGCSDAVKAAVLLDPVDGADPYNIDKAQDLIRDGEKVNFTVPTLFLDNGLDHHNNFAEPSCMPNGLGTQHWLKGWSGPYWRVNATAYGHIDCLDSQGVGSLVCPTNGKTDKGAYRQMIADTTHVFLSNLFEGKQAEFKNLEDPAKFGVAVELNHDLMGLTYEQVLPGCKRPSMQHSSEASSVLV